MPFYILLSFFFFSAATAHFKGSHDGWGAIIKSWARKVINENPFNCPIDDAQSLFMAAKDHFKNAEFFYCSKDNVKAKSELYGIDKREKAAKILRTCGRGWYEGMIEVVYVGGGEWNNHIWIWRIIVVTKYLDKMSRK